MKSMLKTTVVLLTAFIVAMTNTGRASLLAYESFNYTTSIPNGTASTASGFTGNWSC